MTTANTLIDRVRRSLADYTDESFSDSDIFEGLNEGANTLAYTTGCLQATASITTVVTAYSYSLDSNCTNWVNVYQVSYDGTPLAFSPRYEIDTEWGASAGTPTKWSVWGANVYLDLKATALASGLTVFYTKTPTRMTATSSVFGLQQEHEPATCKYAEYYCLKARREEGLADRVFAEFEVLRKSTAQMNEAKLMGGGYA